MNQTELFSANSEHQWQLATDQVMGGVSQGTIQAHAEGVSLQGLVSYENNGGFVQMKWPFAKDLSMRQFDGVWFEACSTEQLVVDAVLKSSQLWMPWQSFRHSLQLTQDWQSFFIPFSDFAPYRTQTRLNPNSITQFALLLGEQGSHQITVRRFGLYSV